jgi:hypothetical protein
MLTIDPSGRPGVQYGSADEVRGHITLLTDADPETLADLARGLLAEVENLRGRAVAVAEEYEREPRLIASGSMAAMLREWTGEFR